MTSVNQIAATSFFIAHINPQPFFMELGQLVADVCNWAKSFFSNCLPEPYIREIDSDSPFNKRRPSDIAIDGPNLHWSMTSEGFRQNSDVRFEEPDRELLEKYLAALKYSTEADFGDPL
jgi:hypothetical protein